MSYIKEKMNISHLLVFGCKCFVLKNRMNNLEKFDAKDDEDIFLRYFTYSKAFRVFIKRTMTIEESFHVILDESNPLSIEVDVVDCICILEKTSLKDDDLDKDKDQSQEEYQSLNGET